MSSDEDEPAPSPSATVLARRASRVVKPMREESSSDDDAEEPEEWEGADETSCSEEEGEEVERVSNAQRGRARLHGVVGSQRPAREGALSAVMCRRGYVGVAHGLTHMMHLDR